MSCFGGLRYSQKAIDIDLGFGFDFFNFYCLFYGKYKPETEVGCSIISQVLGDDRLKHFIRRDFTDDSSDRQNSSETQTD